MFVACVLSLYIIQYILCWRVFLFSFIGFFPLFPKEKKNEKKSSSKSSRLFPFKTEISLPLLSIYIYILLKELHTCICFVPFGQIANNVLAFIYFIFVRFLSIFCINFTCKQDFLSTVKSIVATIFTRIYHKARVSVSNK